MPRVLLAFRAAIPRVSAPSATRFTVGSIAAAAAAAVEVRVCCSATTADVAAAKAALIYRRRRRRLIRLYFSTGKRTRFLFYAAEKKACVEPESRGDTIVFYLIR